MTPATVQLLLSYFTLFVLAALSVWLIFTLNYNTFFDLRIRSRLCFSGVFSSPASSFNTTPIIILPRGSSFFKPDLLVMFLMRKRTVTDSLIDVNRFSPYSCRTPPCSEGLRCRETRQTGPPREPR